MKPSPGEKVFSGIIYLLLAMAGLSCLLPLLHIGSVSLSHSMEVMSGRVGLWPVQLSLDAYQALFKGTRIFSSFYNSLVITIFGVAISMALTLAAAYPLSRKMFPARRFFTLAIVFTMLFSGGVIPTYLLVEGLGLVNTYWALWLPTAISAFNMLIMKTFFESVPHEMHESAKMDGCGEWRLLWQIVLPLSMPMIATITLFYTVGLWNSFFNVLIYINDTKLFNLTVLVQQMILNQMLLEQTAGQEINTQLTPETLKAAGIVVMTLPLVIVYPFLQKYFVKGVMVGAIKG